MSGRPYSTRHLVVLDAIRAFKEEHAYSPSMRDIMEKTEITSLSVVSYYLRRLEDEGFIRRSAHISRSIELVDGRDIEKITPRRVHLHIYKKKANAGRQGRGEGAFIPKKSKKDPGLQKRIDAVVAKAQARDAQRQDHDIIHDYRTRFSGYTMKAHKL